MNNVISLWDIGVDTCLLLFSFVVILIASELVSGLILSIRSEHRLVTLVIESRALHLGLAPVKVD